MKYKDLFLLIANSTDYQHDKLTGADWKIVLNHDEKRILVLLQETKTWWDWIFNFLIIPICIGKDGEKIVVPLGFYLQAIRVYKKIHYEISLKQLGLKYEVVFTGWSQGGVTSAIISYLYIKNDCKGMKTWENNCRLIIYGTPRFLFGMKSSMNFFNCFESYSICTKTRYDVFLYHGDWIRFFVPFAQKFVSKDVVPDMVLKTLDDKHRVYGHCFYLEGEDF